MVDGEGPFEVTQVGWWCERGGGHLCASPCNSGAVAVYVPTRDADDVRVWLIRQEEASDA